MKIIEPAVELWLQDDPVAHVARCARICYGKESGNDEATIKRLINDKHWSMFRHESVYAMIPTHDRNLKDLPTYYASCPYINIHIFDGYVYVSTNENFMMDNKGYPFIDLIEQYKVDRHKFISIEEHKQITLPMLRYTFKVTTQISTSRELNRVSPNNIAEQSTRYVYENGTICRPHWMTINEANEFNNNHQAGMSTIGRNYINSCVQSFGTYKDLIEINGLHRQDARGVLPIDTATICAYTYSYKEWLEILKKRLYHTTGKAHPNCVIICQMIENKLKELGYEIKF